MALKRARTCCCINIGKGHQIAGLHVQGLTWAQLINIQLVLKLLKNPSANFAM